MILTLNKSSQEISLATKQQLFAFVSTFLSVFMGKHWFAR